MGKITKWTSDYPIDFELVGLVSTMKEYKLGWHLNQLGVFHLIKGEDVVIEFANEKLISISNLVSETDFTTVHLLRNRLLKKNVIGNQYLLTELQQFDYLLKLKNTIHDEWAKRILTKLKECSAIDFCAILDVQKIKAKENLIF